MARSDVIPFPAQQRGEVAPEPLWRHLLGRQLRQRRQQREATLSEIASRAGISPQYLSEIERGLKEPSSEMVAAIAQALDATLLDLTATVVQELRLRARPARLETRSILAMAA